MQTQPSIPDMFLPPFPNWKSSPTRSSMMRGSGRKGNAHPLLARFFRLCTSTVCREFEKYFCNPLLSTMLEPPRPFARALVRMAKVHRLGLRRVPNIVGSGQTPAEGGRRSFVYLSLFLFRLHSRFDFFGGVRQVLRHLHETSLLIDVINVLYPH